MGVVTTIPIYVMISLRDYIKMNECCDVTTPMNTIGMGRLSLFHQIPFQSKQINIRKRKLDDGYQLRGN